VTVARAAVTDAARAPFAIREVALDEPRADEVVVQVAACGVCHTDLSLRDQQFPTPLPIVLGHEGAGVVERVGSAVTRVVPGDRVVLSFDSCGYCRACASGASAHCYEHYDLNFRASRQDGTTAISHEGVPVHSHFFGQSTFATAAVVAQRTVHRIPDHAPFEIVAPFGCGVQTGAGTILNVLRPEPASSVAVFGVGCVGMAAVMAARLAACAVIVAVDVNSARLELAHELGATHIVHAGDEEVIEHIRELTAGGADYAVDATGVPSVLHQAVGCTAPLGTTASVGVPPPGSKLELDILDLIVSGKTVCGVDEGRSEPDLFIPRLLELWRQGRFPVDRLIRTFPFDEINVAAAAATAPNGDVVKPVLVMRDPGRDKR
jgi:aryl-alcohol dehydrogenase